MIKGTKGGKRVSGAKLAHHIRKVAAAKERLDKVSKAHNDFVREIYANNSNGSVAGTPANIPLVNTF